MHWNGLKMKRDKANTLLFYDLVENILSLSETPGELGRYLTESIRELIGSRIVMLHYLDNEEMKLLDVCPRRKKDFSMPICGSSTNPASAEPSMAPTVLAMVTRPVAVVSSPISS